MRIVDRATFLALPPNTVFNKYAPCYFDEPSIKGETWGNDFLVQDFDGLGVDEMMALETGESLPLNFDLEYRDGLFDDNQLFAIWDENDAKALIARLLKCIKWNTE